MPREKVTLTLDTARLHELRERVGARSLSAAVDGALQTYLDHLRHLEAVDAWLLDLERKHGPVPPETLEWAAKLVDVWATERSNPKRQAG